MARGGQSVIDFVTAVFDATPLRRFDDGQGHIMHAEMRIDDSVIMLADAHGDWPGGAGLGARLRGGTSMPPTSARWPPAAAACRNRSSAPAIPTAVAASRIRQGINGGFRRRSRRASSL
jgi:hypothetical protein